MLIETGLRGRDAGNLDFNPMIDDSVGWPCLRFDNTKVGSEQLIPLSAKAAEVIRAQQDHDRRQWPAGTPWLFPGVIDNADGLTAPSAASSSPGRTASTRDEAGEPARVTAQMKESTLVTQRPGQRPFEESPCCSGVTALGHMMSMTWPN